jgi:branched-chain amino acid transport system permease protein
VVAVLATVAGLALMGYLIERVAIRPLDRHHAAVIGAYGWILTTAGVALIFQNVVELAWASRPEYSPRSSRRGATMSSSGSGRDSSSKNC